MSHRIRILKTGAEYDVPGTVMTLHTPKGIDRSLGFFTYSAKTKDIHFIRDGAEVRTPDNPQLLEERTVSEEFGVWDGSQTEPQSGRLVFWLAEFVRPRGD